LIQIKAGPTEQHNVAGAEAKMLRILSSVLLSFIAIQGAAKAEDQNLRSSLQVCLDEATGAGQFDKARMGERGTLVLRCSDQAAEQMYRTLADRVPERNVTFPNRDKGTERRFGLSTCYTVKEKANGIKAAEFSCRIAISVGARLLDSF
jgi:hypothetical protein